MKGEKEEEGVEGLPADQKFQCSGMLGWYFIHPFQIFLEHLLCARAVARVLLPSLSSRSFCEILLMGLSIVFTAPTSRRQ